MPIDSSVSFVRMRHSPEPDIRGQFIKIGLEDPFIRAIAGMVAIATAVGFVVSVLGDGTRAVIAVGLSLMFGVVLIVLRVLMNNTEGAFVKWLCLASSAIIIGVFLVLIIFAVPAITVCWPESYRETLGLKACAMQTSQARAFALVAYSGQGISLNPDNKKYLVLVFYRSDRQSDAEHIVGALLSAGYRADARDSALNEVVASNRSPGVSLIKTSELAQPVVDDVSRITQLAIPVRASAVMIFPGVVDFARGNIQIDLF
jgi:hypothetical protein